MLLKHVNRGVQIKSTPLCVINEDATPLYIMNKDAMELYIINEETMPLFYLIFYLDHLILQLHLQALRCGGLPSLMSGSALAIIQTVE